MERIDGKHFSLVDSFGMITKIYKIVKRISLEHMVYGMYVESVDSIEEEVESGIRRTFFFDNAKAYEDEGIQIVLLTFDDSHECVVVNT